MRLNRFAKSLLLLLALIASPAEAAENDPSFILAEAKRILAGNQAAFGPTTTVVKAEVRGDTVNLTLSAAFAPLAKNPARTDEAVRLLLWAAPKAKTLHLFVETPDGPRPLDDFVRAKRPKTVPVSRLDEGEIRPANERSLFPLPGPLAGKTIFVSPGHGWYWVEDLEGWHTQRGEINSIIEDFTNWRMASHVIEALEHTGAYVFSCRERDINPYELIVDNDQGGSGYSDGPLWWTSDYPGWDGGTYRAAETITDPDAASVAEWTPVFPIAARYAVYVAYKAGDNRVGAARYLVRHAYGVSEVLVNQRVNDLRWLYIGSYDFNAGGGRGEGLRLSTYSADGAVVIADAVKFGGGMGSTLRDGAPSGKPRWQEAARYWAPYVGAPEWAYNADLADDAGDVTTRPFYANWQGGDAYLSLHSNAYGAGDVGTGTETYMYSGIPTSGSENWRDAIHEHIVTAIRAQWDPEWTDRGVKSANFGEVRELDAMPGCLTEIGFHDTAYDAEFLRRPPFRATVARAIARAALQFFNTNKPVYPLPVRYVRAQQPSPGRLMLQWEPSGDPVWGDEAAPSGYKIYRLAMDGEEPAVYLTAETRYLFDDLAPGRLYVFRIAATNGGGESLWSEPLAARLHAVDAPQILIVNGFDRLDRSVQEEGNTRDYAIRHARLMSQIGNYYFVSASNEAVAEGLVNLTAFEMVDWIAGEEARLANEQAAFAALSGDEQRKLAVYLDRGGHLFISGSEIGWDFAENGGEEVLDFYAGYLRARYLGDDAETYAFKGVDNSLFDGLAGFFDNGAHGVYDVDFPDLLAAGEEAELCLTYGETSQGAAVCYDGDYRLIYSAIPYETIYDDAFASAFMDRALDFLATAGRDPDDVDEEGDGDWELDLDVDAEIPPDGDPEFVDLADDEPDNESRPDGDAAPDGDAPGSDGDADDGADGDGAPLECPAGAQRQGGSCIPIDDDSGGGCAAENADASAFIFCVLLWSLLRRREEWGVRR
ncbi:MAG: hypothetical protein C4523_17805 [Myxococcales bacterium]|nr:MAG: hypothetical protein C4523_17805 [Myxococcales bacterium]